MTWARQTYCSLRAKFRQSRWARTKPRPTMIEASPRNKGNHRATTVGRSLKSAGLLIHSPAGTPTMGGFYGAVGGVAHRLGMRPVFGARSAQRRWCAAFPSLALKSGPSTAGLGPRANTACDPREIAAQNAAGPVFLTTPGLAPAKAQSVGTRRRGRGSFCPTPVGNDRPYPTRVPPPYGLIRGDMNARKSDPRPPQVVADVTRVRPPSGFHRKPSISKGASLPRKSSGPPPRWRSALFCDLNRTVLQ